jgi:hypothetical protein
MTPHDKRIEDIDRKAGIGRFSPHHPDNFMSKTELAKKRGEVAKKMTKLPVRDDNMKRLHVKEEK